ncbi:MAG TPA: BON domain-containing protein [Gammaproteobacteria bacterium]|nr:BON domain-containing protein [Gammaproteobacteria bacterium]
MNTKPPYGTPVRYTLIAAGVAFGLGIAPAAAGDAAKPQAKSDSLVAAISDTDITANVKLKLTGLKSLRGSDIKVTTTNAVVTLDGTVVGSKAKFKAEEIALAVDGVKSVDDNLRTPLSSKTVAKTERLVSDTWITAKVKSDILADSVSKGFDVSVATNHGVVVLKGSLANQVAIDHVKDIAEKVDGVKSVITSDLIVSKKVG